MMHQRLLFQKLSFYLRFDPFLQTTVLFDFNMFTLKGMFLFPV